MKVNFQGKLRKVAQWPSTMDEFRRVVSRKFTDKVLDDFHNSANDQSDQSMQSLMNSSGFANFLDSNISMRGKKGKRQHMIDWTQVTCFYEDSEGDMNVISEDEDLLDAAKYY
jgi:hypothetical protein